MLMDTRSSNALLTRWISPMDGDTAATAPRSSNWSSPDVTSTRWSLRAYERATSAPRNTPTRPHRVIVNGRLLTRSPHEADDREALTCIGVKQELLIAIRRRLRVGIGQPVVFGYQLAQRNRTLFKQVRLR